MISKVTQFGMCHSSVLRSLAALFPASTHCLGLERLRGFISERIPVPCTPLSNMCHGVHGD